MMVSSNEAELKEIQNKIAKLQIIGAPGAILLGIGLYAMFAAEGYAFHPFLNNQKFVIAIIIIGCAIEIWQLYILIPLFKRKSKMTSDTST